MGGPKNSGGGKPMLFLSLKAKVDAENKPYFIQSEKRDNGWALTNEFDTLEGMISGAKIEEKDLKEHGKKKFFVLYIEYEEGVMKVDMSHNAITYSIINSLASCVDKISDFSIGVWRAKTENEKGTFYNGRAKVLKGGEKTEWAFRWEDVPRKEPVMSKGKQMVKDGKPVWDDTDMRAWWEEKFQKHIVAKVGTGKQKEEKPATSSQGSGVGETFSSSGPEDDLPF